MLPVIHLHKGYLDAVGAGCPGTLCMTSGGGFPGLVDAGVFIVEGFLKNDTTSPTSLHWRALVGRMVQGTCVILCDISWDQTSHARLRIVLSVHSVLRFTELLGDARTLVKLGDVALWYWRVQLKPCSIDCFHEGHTTTVLASQIGREQSLILRIFTVIDHTTVHYV